MKQNDFVNADNFLEKMKEAEFLACLNYTVVKSACHDFYQVFTSAIDSFAPNRTSVKKLIINTAFMEMFQTLSRISKNFCKKSHY